MDSTHPADGLDAPVPDASVPDDRAPDDRAPDDHVLDNPVWASLTGVHAHLAVGTGGGRAYPADVSPFSGLADQASPRDWADLAQVAGPGAVLVVPALAADPPAGFRVDWRLPGVQLVAGPEFCASVAAEPTPPGVLELTADDVPEMLDLTARTRPGPFAERTRLLGRYVGVREGGRLVAMAGERLHPPGFTEISAVCTDESVRGRGLATLLVRAVAAGVVARGETPFLHAAAVNTSAVRLYRALGFALRREIDFAAVVAPA